MRNKKLKKRIRRLERKFRRLCTQFCHLDEACSGDINTMRVHGELRDNKIQEIIDQLNDKEIAELLAAKSKRPEVAPDPNPE